MSPCRSPAFTCRIFPWRPRFAPNRNYGARGRHSRRKPPLEKIIAVSEKAVCMSIATGMTKAQAELCAELALRLRSALQESAAHAALLDCAQSFSPCVEDSARDTVLLDLAGMESLFGPLPEIARGIHDRAAALGLEANVAIASNPDTAVLAARGLCVAASCGAASPVGHCNPPWQRSGSIGPCQWKFYLPIVWKNDQKKNRRLACSKPSTAGASATCARWPHCRNCVKRTSRTGRSAFAAVGARRCFAHSGARGSATDIRRSRRTGTSHRLARASAFLLNRLLEQLCARLGSRALATQELRLTLELENFASVISNQQSTINNFSAPCACRFPCSTPKFFSNCCNWI